MKRLPIIISTMWFVAASIMAQNQKQFIVADKNGNSPLVQSLIFQQQDANERFSWKAEGEAGGYQADRDIKDLLFIARANAELATVSSEDVTKILEDVSGKDGISVEAFISALHANPNVENAYSEDGSNLILKLRDSHAHVVYPLYEDTSLFPDYSPSQEMARRNDSVCFPNRGRAKDDGLGWNGKVAIFNHFQGMKGYHAQNDMVYQLEKYFEQQGYDVEYYGKNANPGYGSPDYEQMFNHTNLTNVIENSKDYKAILIFSHGFEANNSYLKRNGRTYFATCEKIDVSHGAEWYIYSKEENAYYHVYPVEGLNAHNDCIVYLGSCFGVPSEGFSTAADAFPQKNNTVFIGWQGANVVSQADALLTFYLMLYGGASLKKALSDSFQHDYKYLDSKKKSFHIPNNKTLAANDKSKKLGNGSDVDYSYDYFYDKYDDANLIAIEGNVNEFNDAYFLYHPYLKFSLEAVWPTNKSIPYQPANVDTKRNNRFLLHYSLKDIPEGLYLHRLDVLRTDEKWSPLKSKSREFLFFSGSLKENAAQNFISKEEIQTPAILDECGEQLDTITLSVGTDKAFAVDCYEGHILNSAILNEDIAKISFTGKSLTVTGISEGTTLMGIYDTDNKQLCMARIIVRAGDELIAYTSCPDDHHPHLIDLGLPSGTKWACCNVGASKPETRGEEYAWGETEYKNYCSLENYTLCPNGDVNSFPFYGDIAGTEYDVAHVKWGGKWQIPSMEHLKELVNVCSSEWTQNNGVNGRFFTGPNGGKIFLPAETNWGEYWSSNQITYGKCYSYTLEFDCYFAFDPDSRSSECYWGRLIRPIILSDDNVPTTDDSIISFADPKVKAVCVARWDTNGDGELSKAEASAVTSLDDAFKNNKDGITSFNELQYFTNLTSLGMGFTNCLSLISIIIPNSVLSFGAESFFCCRDLVSINIPNRVSSIRRAFVGCGSLTSITIPKSVKKISERAFQNCSKLKQVHSYIEEPFTIDSSVFDGISDDATLYVPAGCKAKYEATEGWNLFKNIVEME